ncbi:hypothetical protein RLOC_00015118 [Lonchura striata]|uniref:Sperm-associated antigen 8 n=1 Tax=Lonchura striata TaxID=40157 RepID=A0A218UY63_9PASE|nr:hypothetical protein RLOC_00015118 [Lonchura striata domestica]
MGSRCHGERPPFGVQGDEPLPEVPVERLPCGGDLLTTTTKRLQEMSDIAKPPQEMADTDELPTVALPDVPSRVSSPETGQDPSGIKLSPWLGKWGTSPEEESSTTVLALPPTPAEKPSQSVPKRSRVTCDWQKEVPVNPLDSRPGKDLGSEDFQRLPTSQGCATGESKEMEEEIHPSPRCMESISTTHHDYRAMGFQSTPQPITQPHNYLTEQPTSFWLEQARRLPGVTALYGRNIPFKRNADFSTPITMYLGHPKPFNLHDPYDPLSSQLQPHRQ